MSEDLFIFVEGSDDERYFGRIIIPLLRPHYPRIRVIPYAQRRARRTDTILRAAGEMRTDYLFVADYDYADSYNARKRDLCRRYRYLDAGRIILVRREIEGWYLAGLEDSAARDWGIPPPGNTDHLTKEQFNELIPPEYFPRVLFLHAILDHYSLRRGTGHNSSLKWFCMRHRLES